MPLGHMNMQSESQLVLLYIFSQLMHQNNQRQQINQKQQSTKNQNNKQVKAKNSGNQNKNESKKTKKRDQKKEKKKEESLNKQWEMFSSVKPCYFNPYIELI